MTAPIALYLAMTLTLAAIVAIHAAHVLTLVRDHGAQLRQAWTFLPGVASVMVWRDGARALPVALVVAVVTYGLLWAGHSV